MTTTKIVLITDVPVDTLHEMKTGNTYEVLRFVGTGAVVLSNTTGDEITVLRREYKITEATR